MKEHSNVKFDFLTRDDILNQLKQNGLCFYILHDVSELKYSMSLLQDLTQLKIVDYSKYEYLLEYNKGMSEQ